MSAELKKATVLGIEADTLAHKNGVTKTYVFTSLKSYGSFQMEIGTMSFSDATLTAEEVNEYQTLLQKIGDRIAAERNEQRVKEQGE